MEQLPLRHLNEVGRSSDVLSTQRSSCASQMKLLDAEYFWKKSVPPCLDRITLIRYLDWQLLYRLIINDVL